ncbi:MAG: 4-phosphopantetheinyl transferase [Bacteroidetes bacterium MedPE-SWsnd-G2]|nr:MAG: 4-phosphopantetheinyl transferase [Bacteroidetes bacterium MedPE-SWsnd-G2]
MPLYKSLNPNSQTSVKIWKITESLEALKAPVTLKPESEERLNGMKSEIHQRGFLSVRHLLRAFGYTDLDLYYDALGKPHLKDGRQISITHSFTFSAVIVSDSIVGIDIEMQREKITRIARKFIDFEADYLKSGVDLVNRLTVIWGAKESLYKLAETPGLSFKNNCLVLPFTMKNDTTTAWIDFNNHKSKYEIRFLEFEGFTCAYALS